MKGGRSCSGSSIRATRTEGGCALEGSYRAAVHGTAARVYQVRAAIPWRTMCLPPPRKTTNNVSNVANRTFTFSFEIRDHGHRERWPGHPMPLGSDAAAAPATALEVASPTGRSTRTVERQVMSADQPMVAHDAVPASRSAAARLLRSASRPVTVHSGPATAASWTGLIPVHAVRAVVLAHLRGYAERTNQVVHSAAGLQSSSEAYGLRCGMVRARQAAGASLLPLARCSCCSSSSPASSRPRPRPPSGRSPTSSTPPPGGTASTPTWCTPSSPSSRGTAPARNRPPAPRA